MYRRRLLILLPALVLISLTACGYSLRGAGGATPGFADLRLDLAQSGPEMARLLRRDLETAGIRLHQAQDSTAAVFPLLSLGPEQFSGRPATTTAQARTAQITLQLVIRINLLDGERTLIDAETLSVERTYYEDLRNIAGNREEAELLRREMRQELVARLLRRLGAAGP